MLNKFFDPSNPYFDQSEASKSKMDARGPQNGVGYDRKVLLETGTGYRIFKILIPFYIAGTGNLRLLSVSGLSGTGFFIPDSVSGRNRIKELTGIPAGILKDLFALKLKKIRALLRHLIGSSNLNRFLGTVKSIRLTS